METYISAVFKILDRFRKRPLLPSEVSIYINNQRQRPIYKPGGYFVFTDLPSGETCFLVVSPAFQQEVVVAYIPSPGNGYLQHHLLLNPSSGYPYSKEVTTVEGRLFHNKMPYADAPFYLILAEGGEVMKVAEEKGEAGNTQIKLFATVPEWQLSFPCKYLIKDKDKRKEEVCLITHRSSSDGVVALETGLSFSHVRGTHLVEVIECRTLEDGSFFAALPELKKEKATLDLLCKGLDQKNLGQGNTKTIEILGHQTNIIGDIHL